jgi:hypothetical protein
MSGWCCLSICVSWNWICASRERIGGRPESFDTPILQAAFDRAFRLGDDEVLRTHLRATMRWRYAAIKNRNDITS